MMRLFEDLDKQEDAKSRRARDLINWCTTTSLGVRAMVRLKSIFHIFVMTPDKLSRFI